MRESERRKEVRANVSASALVFVANAQHSCPILNLSAGGIQLVAPGHGQAGLFVRLNLALPAFEERIDVDGVIVRESEEGGRYSWSIEFINPTPHAVGLIRTYIGWARDHTEDLRRSQHRLSTSRALRSVGGGITGPDHPVVSEAPRPRRESTGLSPIGTGPGHPAVAAKDGGGRVTTGRGHPAVAAKEDGRRVTTGRGHPAVAATGPGYPPVTPRAGTGPGYPPVGKGSDPPPPADGKAARPGTDPAHPRVRLPASPPAAVDDDLDFVELRKLYQDALKTVGKKEKS